MILTVTLNAALDKTYQVDELMLGAVHRAEVAHAQAGGKGINVARALAGAGLAVLAAGLAAGSTGDQIERDLEIANIDAAIYRFEGESRQTVTVTSRRGDTWLEIDEQGPELSPASWRSFLDSMEAHLHEASVVVLSGSLPPGTPVDAYRHLTELSHNHGANVVVDAAGPALEHALAAGPEFVTPNRPELKSASGLGCDTLDEVVDACHKLEDRGARGVVATLGPDGAVATRGAQAWRARHPVLSGNPVGAGDALVAGIAVGLVNGASLEDILLLGCAWALASLESPWAGHVSPDALAAAQPRVIVEPVESLAGKAGWNAQ